MNTLFLPLLAAIAPQFPAASSASDSPSLIRALQAAHASAAGATATLSHEDAVRDAARALEQAERHLAEARERLAQAKADEADRAARRATEPSQRNFLGPQRVRFEQRNATREVTKHLQDGAIVHTLRKNPRVSALSDFSDAPRTIETIEVDGASPAQTFDLGNGRVMHIARGVKLQDVYTFLGPDEVEPVRQTGSAGSEQGTVEIETRKLLRGAEAGATNDPVLWPVRRSAEPKEFEVIFEGRLAPAAPSAPAGSRAAPAAPPLPTFATLVASGEDAPAPSASRSAEVDQRIAELLETLAAEMTALRADLDDLRRRVDGE